MYKNKKRSEQKSGPAVTEAKTANLPMSGLQDNRPEAIAQKRIQHRMSVANQPVQRIIRRDLELLGLNGVHDLLSQSPRGVALIQKADAKGIELAEGVGRARTFHPGGGGRIMVQIPIKGQTELKILKNVTFELNNAIRQQSFDDVRTAAATGAIPDKDQYAREIIRLEIAGMLSTGAIGMELAQKGAKIDYSQMMIAEYFSYVQAKKKNPKLTVAAYIDSKLDEVLDRRHELGSHREVYTKQFDEDYANPTSLQARENYRLAKKNYRLANQMEAIAQFSNYLDAVAKLKKEEPDQVDSVQAYVAQNRETYKYLHLAFIDDPMFRSAEQLEHATNKEAALATLTKEKAAVLFSWVERNDDGRFRNLTQILGMYLGYYQNKPELLRVDIYKH